MKKVDERMRKGKGNNDYGYNLNFPRVDQTGRSDPSRRSDELSAGFS